MLLRHINRRLGLLCYKLALPIEATMIKNLLVNLSTLTKDDPARDYAISLAREFGAHLAAVAFAYEPIPS